MGFKTIVVVDDNVVNRNILVKILSKQYCVLQAENGQSALELLERNESEIAGILLDLVMPVMDGYEFLKIVSADVRYKDLPVIVVTGSDDQEDEKKALQLGAWDFITKPFDADIVAFRLHNAIIRSQLATFEQLQYLATHDTLTGIYNKAKFFDETRQMLNRSPHTDFVMIHFDINRFSLINSFYGVETGDKLLKQIAVRISEFSKTCSEFTYARIEADVFACCIPQGSTLGIEYLAEQSKTIFDNADIDFDIIPCFGIYQITDKAIPVSQMLDYANLAAKQIKGNYTQNYAFYSPEMSIELEKEQNIVNEMKNALLTEQFTVYLQPKYSLKSGALAGAEALVRWIHPQKGMIMPGDFIPVFERNGFIVKLDYYVWEKTCALLRTWIDKGYPLLPVSVNVSRVNLYSSKLVENICELTKKYQIPRNLLNLEVTESSYSTNSEVLIRAIHQLHQEGFTIMMDDFGSGYSSLNILKDINIDILKLDMKFLSDAAIPGRGENIISSVIRIAKWLDMPTIAEGVENKRQAEFLQSIGCEFAQGYHFSKPIKVSDYEQLLKTTPICDNRRLTPKKKQHKKPLWSQQFRDLVQQDSCEQPIVLYEFSNKHIEFLRVSPSFYKLFGEDDHAINTVSTLENSPYVSPYYYTVILNAFQRVAETKEVTVCEYQRKLEDGSIKWIRSKLRYIQKIGDRHIVMGALLDITEQKEAELLLQEKSDPNGVMVKQTILIIDDVAEDREMLTEVLKERYFVLSCSNTKDDLMTLQTNPHQIDLMIISETVLAELTSEEFKKDKLLRTPFPIIVMANTDNESVQRLAFSIGVKDFILKSSLLAEFIVARVENVIAVANHNPEIYQKYRKAIELSRKDSLTGLYNRIEGERKISQILEYHQDQQHAMLMFDIDYLKSINDQYGHAVGDQVLVALSGVIQASFRKEDILVRMGGDEFMVFIPDVPSKEILFKKCEVIRNKITKINIDQVHLSCSIGIAIAYEHGSNFQELYEQSDQALYDAKNLGRNRCKMFQHKKEQCKT